MSYDASWEGMHLLDRCFRRLGKVWGKTRKATRSHTAWPARPRAHRADPPDGDLTLRGPRQETTLVHAIPRYGVRGLLVGGADLYIWFRATGGPAPRGPRVDTAPALAL